MAQFATITGWGKCMPPAILSNADLATFLPTDDEWIRSRTGIHERRISHVPLGRMAEVAARRALAGAGLEPGDLDLIVFGTCSMDEQVPNMASGLQATLGAPGAGAMDVNTACTSFLYGLTTASAMIKAGTVRNALVIGGELISPMMDWMNRNVAVLFGDGCAAVVVEASDREEGVLGEQLGCLADVRHTLRVRGMGTAYCNHDVTAGVTAWDFDGQEIFRHAVQGMVQASAAVMKKCGVSADDIDLVVPHQANLRIIDAVVSRAGIPSEKVMLTVQRYGNMSAATVPVALRLTVVTSTSLVTVVVAAAVLNARLSNVVPPLTAVIARLVVPVPAYTSSPAATVAVPVVDPDAITIVAPPASVTVTGVEFVSASLT